MIDAGALLNFAGRDWQVLKKYLEDARETKVGLLINAKSHDDSNKLRGSLDMIAQLLRLDKAAERPLPQG
jgi:glycerophosphoryl diester phosphodiesterase